MKTPERPEGAPLDLGPDSPPTADEVRAADELRAALEDPSVRSEDAELLRALAFAEAPRALRSDLHRAILERALERAPKKKAGRLVRVAFGASAAVALAAGVVLMVKGGEAPSGAPSGAQLLVLAQVRSTQPLFVEPFAHEGGESARVDRIALARASDFRDNEFRRWGVR